MISKFIVPQLDEKELQAKLSDIRYPNEFQDDSVGWTCGAPTWAVQDMVHEWKHNFRWEKSREKINRWHHYQTHIEGLNIHFVHEPSANDDAIPIVLLHGWPSTFYEFHKIIEPLRDGHNNATQSFHVVVPSLPGYGFSEAPKSPGCGVPQIGNIMDQLMTKLGYEKYVVFGTDWGAFIGTKMAQDHADHCLGFFTTMPTPSPPWPTLTNLIFHPFKVLNFILAIFLGFDRIYGENESKGLLTGSFANVDKTENAGYRAIQSTRPYTLAYGLTDSPVGLLGWMLDPYHHWTNIEGSVATVNKTAIPDTITVDEFLTQVTIYWITNTMSSSTRLYYETRQNRKSFEATSKLGVKVPMAVSYFKGEIIKIPRDWNEVFASNLIQYKSHQKGGHFAALEVPDILLNDIQQFGSTLSKKTQRGKKDL